MAEAIEGRASYSGLQVQHAVPKVKPRSQEDCSRQEVIPCQAQLLEQVHSRSKDANGYIKV